MKLYSDDLIELTYTAAQDLLYAAWQEQRPYSTAEVKKAFMAIVASAREHNIKRILLNFSENTKDFLESEYKALLTQLAVGLLHTMIEKIACIGPGHSEREVRIGASFEEIRTASSIALQFRYFSNRAEAFQWLIE
ncbi:hypothetical protein [Pontibacter vulgaris]|uniref:hypothetical protein n=1 Tax=Pontibacter vulgaris TaxID=2905679 RepID=UPI001FA7C56D|nr:hypothetical protein [Pontibacter vulgaris]